jgi:carbonic anhydrase/acetyltransferase-like protein (isoleucine patch superfamily)
MIMRYYEDKKPIISPESFVAEGVRIIGDVIIGKNSNIWFNAVLRGDVAPIRVGEGTNIQDNCVIHTSRFGEKGAAIIGNNITIGHAAIIHACVIEDNSFIGMASTIMDGAIVENYGYVAAGALVSPGKIVRSYELWAGVPAKFIRKITDSEIAHIIDSPKFYVELAKKYHDNSDII